MFAEKSAKSEDTEPLWRWANRDKPLVLSASFSALHPRIVMVPPGRAGEAEAGTTVQWVHITNTGEITFNSYGKHRTGCSLLYQYNIKHKIISGLSKYREDGDHHKRPSMVALPHSTWP